MNGIPGNLLHGLGVCELVTWFHLIASGESETDTRRRSADNAECRTFTLTLYATMMKFLPNNPNDVTKEEFINAANLVFTNPILTPEFYLITLIDIANFLIWERPQGESDDLIEIHNRLIEKLRHDYPRTN